MQLLPRLLHILPAALLPTILGGCSVRVAAVPEPGPAVVLDGTVTAAEWGELPESSPDGDVQLRMAGRVLYVAVRAPVAHPVHLYLARGDEVHVLHASAALGRAVYRRGEDGEWTVVERFTWRVRDPRMGPGRDPAVAEAERRAHLAEHGWTANTIGMGVPGHVEFAVGMEYLGREGALLAASWFAGAPDRAENIRRWPGDAVITADELRLLRGEEVPARFELSGWVLVGAEAKEWLEPR